MLTQQQRNDHGERSEGRREHTIVYVAMSDPLRLEKDGTAVTTEKEPGGELVDTVMAGLRTETEKMGMEVYPFKMAWYNRKVDEIYRFQLQDDTLAVSIISAPSMFEKLILPYLMTGDSTVDKATDPLDRCIRGAMEDVIKNFPEGYKIEFIQDSNMWPSRRAKILVQTAGHEAGAAYYYQRTDVKPQPWSPETNIFGVSVHPRYGSWFALRGVLIFHGLQVPELVQTPPTDCVTSRENRIKLLEKYNFSWQDFQYKDVIDGGEVEERYSEKQKTYFSTEPRNRFQLVQKWRSEL